MSEPKGALVAQVNKGSPADKAGIKIGDVIVHYDGREVPDTRSLRNAVAATVPGTKVQIELLRHGKPETVTATIGKLEETTTAAAPSKEGQSQLARLGLSVQTLTPDLAKQFNIEADKGVVITGVEAGSVASLANLQPGDVILEADRQPVASVADLEQILAKAKDKDNILLLVNHQGTTLFVVLQMH